MFSTPKQEEEYSELKGLDPSFFKLNRTNYINNLKIRNPHLNINSVIVLQGGNLIPKYDGDTSYYYFDQESNFYYLTGVREPNMKCIIDIRSNDCILFYQKEEDDMKIWMKVPSYEDIEKKYAIKTLPMENLNSFLQDRNMEVIYLLSGVNENSNLPCLTAELNFKGDYEYLQKKISHDKYTYMVLCDTRRVKNEKEKELLKYIGKISNLAHIELIKKIKPGMNERDMENIFLQYMRDNYYCRFFAYNCICATGKNSATLHYDLNNKKMEDGDLFLTDMGIRFCGYVSDITITIPVNGKFTDKQKEIYNIVLKSNRETIKSIKPGITRYKDMDKLSKIIILEGLQEINILKKDFTAEEMYNNRLWYYFMPHSLGHLVGLDVHDVGLRSVSYKSLQIIDNGTFITVEPGIYFVDFLMDEVINTPNLCKYVNVDKLEEYRGFGGVRIEDDVMVHENSVESYQEDLPRKVEEIEKIMKGEN